MASIKKRDNGKWRARYRDAAGKEHARHFARKVDAQRWLDEVTTSVVTGQYVDPNAGRVTFRDYAEQWRAAQVHRESTAEQLERRLRLHVYPTFGDRPLGSNLPTEVQAWVRGLPLAPSSAAIVFGYLNSVMRAAVRDRRIVANPCEGTKLPKRVRAKVTPPTTDQVEALRDGLPDRLSAAVTVAAGTGMRQGELFGLTVDRLSMLGRTVTVDRQLVRVEQRARLGPRQDRREQSSDPSAAGGR